MRISTVYKTLLCFLLFIYISLPNARAQFPLPPVLEDTACVYDEPHLYLAYEAIIEDSTDLDNLTVVINAIVPEANPRGIDVITFLAPGPDAILVTYTLDELAADPFVELIVNRDAFLLAPGVIVTASQSINFLGISTWPLNIINFRSRLNTDEPCVPITPLPVELVSFEGTASENNVALKWSTASELDNKQFEVEHSTDGQRFSQVGIVEGHGNSSVPVSYAFVHQNPASGLNYYRLKQVDFSGAFEYSKVIAVTYAGTVNPNMQVTVFPNPCQNGDCQVSISNLHGAPETVLELKDMTGKVVFSKTIKNEGQTNIALPMQELGSYRGLYILTASTGANVVHKRVVLD